MREGERVLVTGGSGFVGAHCIVALLDAGYRVRTTVRTPGREADVLAQVERGGAKPGPDLEFATADLLDDAGWADAVAGCAYVLHVASPFPGRQPRDANDVIRPAREGALRVLRAARDAGVRRVVLTSSFAAVGYGAQAVGPEFHERPFTEEDWTNPDADVSAYVRSKTLAERAAWDFMDREGGALELAVVNPVGILGPVLGPDLSTSIDLVLRLLNGRVPGLPNVSFGMVDVRDVADLHVRAMTNPDASGERFLAVSDGILTVPQVARLLHDRLGDVARRVPTRTLPDWMVRVAAAVDPSLREVARQLGQHREVSNAKARRMLGWAPRSNEDMLVATAESLFEFGIVPAA